MRMSLERFPHDLYGAHARYNGWMNERIYDCAARLSDEQRKRDVGAFFRSVHLTLTHLLIADRAWLARFGCAPAVWQSRARSGQPIAIRSFDQDVYPDFDELRAERRRTDRDILEFVAGLTDDTLARDFEYKRASGEGYRHPLWWAVSHFFNHQTHHRGQVTTLLKQLDIDPGVTDLVIMLREGWGDGGPGWVNG
jgi:uncharacterized damage-inducible protein DinB